MPVTDVTTDPQSLTMALTAEFPVPVERLWLAFTDPRQLERFWGLPTMRMTFEFETTPTGLRAFAEGKGTEVELLGDNQARITRLVEGPSELVWRGHGDGGGYGSQFHPVGGSARIAVAGKRYGIDGRARGCRVRPIVSRCWTLAVVGSASVRTGDAAPIVRECTEASLGGAAQRDPRRPQFLRREQPPRAVTLSATCSLSRVHWMRQQVSPEWLTISIPKVA